MLESAALERLGRMVATMAEISAAEAERLAVLERYRVLDSDFDEAFDAITRQAAAEFKVPVALITLIDRDRQWFKSMVGVPVRETPRDVAICEHAIRQNDVMVVPNAAVDSRFADNPLVQSMSIRFYAGAPLRTDDGYALGTICIIDRQARPTLTSDEKQKLEGFAGRIMALLEARRAAAG